MADENCVIVRTSGRQLDALRVEASRIANAGRTDWSVERTDKGRSFCFGDNSEVKTKFEAYCLRNQYQLNEG